MRLFAPRHTDGERLIIAGNPVRLRVSARARRVSLRIDVRAREAIAVAPTVRALEDAARFARERRAWIAERLAAPVAAPPVLAPGGSVSVFGAAYRLDPDGRRPRLLPGDDTSPARLSGCGEGVVDGQLVARAIRAEAARVFPGLADGHCRALGVPRPPVGVMDARTRWGSCTPAHRDRPASIRLSWRLALAPLAVADYVVAHECAHLLEANHGPRFWALVRERVGDPRAHRAWLRAKGAELHLFGT